MIAVSRIDTIVQNVIPTLLVVWKIHFVGLKMVIIAKLPDWGC